MAYDVDANRTKLIDTDGGYFTTTYDALDRVQTVVNPSNVKFTLQYDLDSRSTTIQTGNNSSRATQYDPVRQLTTVIQYQVGSPIITIVDAYAGNGWKTSHNVVTMASSLLTTYTNDAKGRLLGQQGASVYATFSYDAVDNTLVKWHQGTQPMSMSYDAASRITSMLQGAATTTYAFSNSGNMTQEYLPGTGLTVNGYDYENRLLSVITPTGTRSTYAYAGDTGLRRTRQEPSDSAPHTVVWDGSDYLAEY